MYIIIKDNKFVGFSLKEESEFTNIEISEVEHKNYIEKQSQGFTFYFNKEKEQLEALKLNQFEYINDSGNIVKDNEAEQKYKNNKITELKRERVQLKKDRKDLSNLRKIQQS